MSRVHAIVEGETEETFIRDIVAPHLAPLAIYLTPILLQTKLVKYLSIENRSRPGRDFKGGVSSYTKIARDVRHLLGSDSGARAVTTMIDYYRLPKDFPGKSDLPRGNPYDRVAHLEQAFDNDINSPRFRSFLMLHEFEALLFTDTNEIAAVFPAQNVVDSLAAVRAAFDSPEEINEGLTKHPSARIKQVITGY